MLYKYSLAIPASTTKAAPTEARAKLTEGYITHVSVVLREESEFLTHVAIYQGGHQLYPTNPDEDINESGGRNEWADQFYLGAGEHELVIKGWNEDDTYQHTAYIQLTVLPAYLVEEGQVGLSILQRLQKLFWR